MPRHKIDPKTGESTQFPHNDPTKGGRKPSIKRQLEELLEQDGTIKFNPKQVKQIHNDGSVTIILPTKMRLAQKLMSLAMSGNNNTTLSAIRDIMDRVDGKPTQKNEHKFVEDIIFLDKTPDDE